MTERMFVPLSSGQKDLNGVNHPLHRHAAPFSPWPWIDLADAVDVDSELQRLGRIASLVPELCDHSPERCNECWRGYPLSLFPNWTLGQVKKARIYDMINSFISKTCICYRVDMNDSGFFTHPENLIMVHGEEGESWHILAHEKRPKDTHLRALFLQNLSGPVLQMLGTKYNIEPFFWSSSLNWMPSRFQENIKEKVGDHITITLTFLHSMSNQDAAQLASKRTTQSVHDAFTLLGSQSIDPQAPLILSSSQRTLVLDLLSVHLVRCINGSTIISYHPTFAATTAEILLDRIRLTGQSAYWQRIFQKSQDPTFVLLTFIWHSMYAWDEALEDLNEHICSLESLVVSTLEMPVSLIRELLIIRAHHLHYLSLLDYYTKHISFIKDTPNPAMHDINEEDRISSQRLLDRECDHLVNEIERFILELNMQERRLKNVMDLVFSAVNIADSRLTQKMTEAAVRDSDAMKQISYLTMIFLPATFATGIFGMNVGEINPGTKGTISQYIAVTLSFTALTAWIVIAFHYKYVLPPRTSFFRRLAWPVFIFQAMVSRKQAPREPLGYQLGDEDGFIGHLV